MSAGYATRVVKVVAVLVTSLLVVAAASEMKVSAGRALEKGPAGWVHGGPDQVQSRSRRVRAIVARTGFPAGEPTLGLNKAGTVFVAAIEDNLRVDVLRSEDKGRSWQVVSPQIGGQNGHLLSFDPYLYVDDATGRAFTIDLTVACSYLSYSDDEGASWSTNPLACGRPINDHQTLFAGPPVLSPTQGYPRVVYYCFSDVANSACSKSLDGGVSFISTGAPAFEAIDPQTGDLCGGLHGHGAVGPAGELYLPREYCGQPFLAISRDEGATWSRVRVSAMRVRPNDDPAVAVDARGNLYYAFIGKGRLPYLTTSADGGISWSRPVMIAPAGIASVALLTMNVAPDGRLAFAYMGTRDSRHPKTWDGYVSTTKQGLSCHPLLYTAAINPKRDPLKRGDCGPGRCGEDVLDFLDVLVSRNGTPWAAFVDACDDECVRSGLEGGNEGLVARLVRVLD